MTMVKPHAVFATGPDSCEAVPVIDWVEKGGVHQVMTAVIPTPAGRRLAKEEPHFVVVVSEEELFNESVRRMAASVWAKTEAA